ncbi:MAG: cytochrome c biogenesis protein ResB [Oscillospiraceae bacterium]|nr:cytochrome c biogenesis protein ResB [Oscillospiraceae bacterium]
MKFLFKISVIFMMAVTAFIMVLATMQFWRGKEDFENPAVIWALVAVLFCFAMTMVFSLFMRKFDVRKIGFYMLHAGVVLALAGSMLYHVNGVKRLESHMIGEEHMNNPSRAEIRSVMKKSILGNKNQNVETDNIYTFDLIVKSFKVEKYETIYDLYEIEKDAQNPDAEPEYRRVMADVESINGHYDFGKYGRFNAEGLPKEDGKRVDISDEVCIVSRSPDKHYEAQLDIYDNYSSAKTSKTLMVNHPQRVNGWKIFLMSFTTSNDENDEKVPESVVLIFKYDPGEYITLAGWWFIIIGSVIACIFKIGNIGDKATNAAKRKIKKAGNST